MGEQMTWEEACQEAFDACRVDTKFPDGFAPADVLQKVWELHPGFWQMCTVIDVADALAHIPRQSQR